MVERMLRELDVARMTGLGRTTRYEMERRGEFPARRQITPGAVGWLESELLDWLLSRKVGRPLASLATIAARRAGGRERDQRVKGGRV